jgi:regulator of replication initiation timing
MTESEVPSDKMAIYDQIHEKRTLILRLHKEFQEITSTPVLPSEAQKLKDQVANLQARMNKGIKELEELKLKWDELENNNAKK